MSYDIRLKDPVSDETVFLPFDHVMIGGTYAANYNEQTRRFSPRPMKEAWLNITYNYGKYYYEAEEAGIRAIYGKTGLDSLPILDHMISAIKENHSDLAVNDNYWEACPGNAIRPLLQLKVMAQLRPDAVWDGD